MMGGKVAHLRCSLLLALWLPSTAITAADKLGYNCMLDGGSNCTDLIPDASGGVPGQLDSVIVVPPGQCASVERVCVGYGVEHSLNADLNLQLNHGGVTVTLPTGTALSDVFNATIFENEFDGEDGTGPWTLRAIDNQNGEYGALNNWTLGLCCGSDCGDGLIRVNPISGLETTELGGQADFEVELTCHPMREITVSPTSSNPGEGIATGPITFTAENWQSAQTITVTGQDDAVEDGPIAYQVDLPLTIGGVFPGPVEPVLDLYNPPSPYRNVAEADSAFLVNLDNEAFGTPTVTQVIPPPSGNGNVTIEGTGFVPGDTTVTVDGKPCTDVNVISATQLTCNLPPGSSSGPLSFVVSTPGGSSDAAKFIFRIPVAKPIPTLSFWGLILLSSLMLLIYGYQRRMNTMD